MKERYPKMCADMERDVPREYWLNGVPFTKVTIAVNNPTPAHFDGESA